MAAAPVYDGFRYDDDDGEYELGLTPTFKMDFTGPADKFLVTDFPAGVRQWDGVPCINFQIVEDDDDLIIDCIWDPPYGCRLVIHTMGYMIINTVLGPLADFREFLDWLYRRETSVLGTENRQLRALNFSNPPLIRRRLNELSDLIMRVVHQPFLVVPTLLTTRHVDAIAQTTCLVSMPGGVEHFYYVVNATDVQIRGDVDRYSILGIDSLIGLLSIALPTLNVDPRTRAEITRIRRIKFTLQPIERAQLGAAPLARKRALSIGGGKKR